MAKVYLAGPGSEVERVIEHADRLSARGHQLTMPWWERVLEERRRGWKSDADVSADYMAENEEMNRVGIIKAEVLVGLSRAAGGMTPGTAGEVTYALALYEMSELLATFLGDHVGMRKVILVGNPKGWVWSYNPNIAVVETLDDALGLIEALGLA